MPDNAKRAALIAEGLTDAEADYMLSGGNRELPLSSSQDGDRSSSYVGDADDASAQRQPSTGGAQPPAAGDQAAQPQGQPGQAAGDDDDSPEPPRDSPFYQQWHREKRRRQQLQAELRARDERLNQLGADYADLQQKWARIDERLRVFREAVEQQPEAQQQPRPKPDREADPFGYMAWLEEQLDALRPQIETVQRQSQERDAFSALQSAYVADARDFARATPDFAHAYNWLMQNRDAELQAAGYIDPAERMRIIALDERDIVARALHARQTNPRAPGPAQIIYGLARARGFTPPAAGGGAANGSAPGRPQGSPPQGQTVTQQVEAIQRGQAASRSLSSAGGAPVPAQIDLSRIAAMTDAEYLDWKRTLTPAQRREYASLLGAP